MASRDTLDVRPRKRTMTVLEDDREGVPASSEKSPNGNRLSSWYSVAQLEMQFSSVADGDLDVGDLSDELEEAVEEAIPPEHGAWVTVEQLLTLGEDPSKLPPASVDGVARRPRQLRGSLHLTEREAAVRRATAQASSSARTARPRFASTRSGSSRGRSGSKGGPAGSFALRTKRLQSARVLSRHSRKMGLRAVRKKDDPFERRGPAERRDTDDTVNEGSYDDDDEDDDDDDDDGDDGVGNGDGRAEGLPRADQGGRPHHKASISSSKGERIRDRASRWIPQRINSKRRQKAQQQASRKLEKYSRKCSVFVVRQRQMLFELKGLEKTILEEAAAEAALVRSWCAATLVPRMRELALLKLARVRLEMRQCCVWGTEVDRHRDEVEALIADIHTEEGGPLVRDFVASNDAAFFYSPAKHCASLSKSIRLKKQMEEVSRKMEACERVYLAEKAKLRVLSKAEKMTALQSLLMECKAPVDSPAPVIGGGQLASFESLFLDERTSAGAVVWRFLRDNEERRPGDVLEFVDALASDLGRIYEVEERRMPVLQLFVSSMVYRRLVGQLYPDPTGVDRNFHQKCRSLRGRHPTKFGVQAHHLPAEPWGDTLPYGPSIELLESVMLHPVPTDALRVLVEAMRAIYESAREYGKGPALAADDVFPIFVYIVVNSFLPAPWACVQYLNAYASDKERMTEMGYCLTTLEAALSHVTSLDLDEWEARPT